MAAAQEDELADGFASGNGRIEAVEIDIATKVPGRLGDILVDEGDFVSAGQALARMDTAQLAAQLRRAQAEKRRAGIGVDTAASLVRQREAEQRAAVAVIAQRRADHDAAGRRLARSEPLARSNTIPQSVLDDDRAAAQAAEAALAAAEAQLAASEAAIGAAKAGVIDAEAAVEAAGAAIETIQADIDDSTLRASPGRSASRRSRCSTRSAAAAGWTGTPPRPCARPRSTCGSKRRRRRARRPAAACRRRCSARRTPSSRASPRCSPATATASSPRTATPPPGSASTTPPPSS